MTVIIFDPGLSC